MPYDVKKAERELYVPSRKPSIITVPAMQFVAVHGHGDPNDLHGDYQRALQQLYGISFTIKMSQKSKDPNDHIAGYEPYVVPPLEGLWWMPGDATPDFTNKSEFEWISMIRLPDFVTQTDFEHAREKYAHAHADVNVTAEYFKYDEGLCAQVMHIGPYDSEPATISALDDYIHENGYELDLTGSRRHHEIYLSDPRRCAPEKLRTVIRHPIRTAD